jgi:uncharacterized protein (TIGR02246 family)
MMDTPHESIDMCLARMKRAWDAGDAAAYAQEFTEDASYVIYVGLIYFGRAEIERAHLPVFAKWQKGSRMNLRVLQTRMLTAETAVVVTEGGIGKGRNIRRDKVQTFVMVRREGRWLCSAFQNTKRNWLFIRVNQLIERRSEPAGKTDRERRLLNPSAG